MRFFVKAVDSLSYAADPANVPADRTSTYTHYLIFSTIARISSHFFVISDTRRNWVRARSKL